MIKVKKPDKRKGLSAYYSPATNAMLRAFFSDNISVIQHLFRNAVPKLPPPEGGGVCRHTDRLVGYGYVDSIAVRTAGNVSTNQVGIHDMALQGASAGIGNRGVSDCCAVIAPGKP